ncbi:MAG: helix-turn-helix transcriptional regulator [Clostridiales bacterium]|nr:helix-turn-helix transcriptional regulator [Clostridiales bacterium]
MTFAERLSAIRKDCGMTQREVYTKLNMSPNGYASYEQGRTEPNIATIVRLCAIFDVSADYLLGITDYNGEF